MLSSFKVKVLFPMQSVLNWPLTETSGAFRILG